MTLKQEGRLRGCVGNLLGNLELYRTVQKMALAAATQDHRFGPVSVQELPEQTIETSLPTPFEYISDASKVQVGRDGLYVSLGPYSGVLLPQVATEQEWSREEFLNQACPKASLPQDAWQQGAMPCRFEAQVFSEER